MRATRSSTPGTLLELLLERLREDVGRWSATTSRRRGEREAVGGAPGSSESPRDELEEAGGIASCAVTALDAPSPRRRRARAGRPCRAARHRHRRRVPRAPPPRSSAARTAAPRRPAPPRRPAHAAPPVPIESCRATSQLELVVRQRTPRPASSGAASAARLLASSRSPSCCRHSRSESRWPRKRRLSSTSRSGVTIRASPTMPWHVRVGHLPHRCCVVALQRDAKKCAAQTPRRGVARPRRILVIVAAVSRVVPSGKCDGCANAHSGFRSSARPTNLRQRARAIRRETPLRGFAG